MNFELTGKLFEVFPTQQKTEKFRSREFVIETTKTIGDRSVTDYVKFQTTGDRCNLLDKYRVGNEVTVSFNVRGNRWENAGKVSYFTNLEAWKITTGEYSQECEEPQQLQSQASKDFDGIPF